MNDCFIICLHWEEVPGEAATTKWMKIWKLKQRIAFCNSELLDRDLGLGVLQIQKHILTKLLKSDEFLRNQFSLELGQPWYTSRLKPYSINLDFGLGDPKPQNYVRNKGFLFSVKTYKNYCKSSFFKVQLLTMPFCFG